MKIFESWPAVFSVVVGCVVSGSLQAGSLDPTNAPGPTMRTLDEIYQKQMVIDQNLGTLLSPKTLSSTTAVMNLGYYASTTLAAVDADLVANNIKTNVAIFGIAGTMSTGSNPFAIALPKTGQTFSYMSKDDGSYKKGLAWPNPRFTIQADTNCVLDNLTGLIWARNANIGGAMAWADAITFCENLNYGGQTDWRLPNVRELTSLVDWSRYDPSLPSGHPFASVWADIYWTSTSRKNYETSDAWHVHMFYGNWNYSTKTYPNFVWPVRGGQ